MTTAETGGHPYDAVVYTDRALSGPEAETLKGALRRVGIEADVKPLSNTRGAAELGWAVLVFPLAQFVTGLMREEGKNAVESLRGLVRAVQARRSAFSEESERSAENAPAGESVTVRDAESEVSWTISPADLSEDAWASLAASAISATPDLKGVTFVWDQLSATWQPVDID